MISGSKVSEWQRFLRYFAKKEKLLFLLYAISIRVVKNCGKYGVMCVHPAQRGSLIEKFSFLLFLRAFSLFYLVLTVRHAFLFSLWNLSTHERFTSQVKDTCPPVSYSGWSSRHKHRFTHEIFRSSWFDSDPRWGSRILIMLWYYGKKKD